MGAPPPGWGRMFWASQAFKRCTWPTSRNLALALATQADGSLGVSMDPQRLQRLGAKLGLSSAEVGDAVRELIAAGWLMVDLATNTAKLDIPLTTKKRK